MTTSKRIKILTDKELSSFYECPLLTELEQQHYFSLNEQQQNYVRQLKPSSRVYAILQLGYFKAKQRFFSSSYTTAKHDVDFIKQIYVANNNAKIEPPSRNTQSKIKQKLLTLLDYNGSIDAAKKLLTLSAERIVRYKQAPIEIFRELLRLIKQHHYARYYRRSYNSRK